MEYKETHIVVDMLYDFIDGSLACNNAVQAVEESIKYINAHPQQKVLYVCDCHPADHCSFSVNGGTWPVHCIENTRGGAIHENYYTKIENKENRPSKKNIFYKGRDKDVEEYSGYKAVNAAGELISSASTKEVVVSGIATEFCIKETVMNLYRHGFKITLLKKALAYVNPHGHLETLAELGKIISIK
ncbi:MAG: isochorismatase family protein [Bacteroidales bacterium]